MVFAKEECHLCEAVEAEIERVKEIKIRMMVTDIDKDQALYDRYWMRIPVVAIGGREIFEAKMMDTEGKWKARLLSLLKES